MKTLDLKTLQVELTDKEIKLMIKLLQFETKRIRELFESWDKKTQKRFKDVIDLQIDPLTDLIIKLEWGL